MLSRIHLHRCSLDTTVSWCFYIDTHQSRCPCDVELWAVPVWHWPNALLLIFDHRLRLVHLKVQCLHTLWQLACQTVCTVEIFDPSLLRELFLSQSFGFLISQYDLLFDILA